MIRYFILTVTVACSISFSLFADQVPDPEEARLIKLVSASPKMHLSNLLDYNLKKLDVVYQNALKAADPELREALQKSQKAWKEFYLADAVVAGWNAKGGSYQYPAQMEQKIYQVRQRIYQLSTPFVQGWEGAPIVPNPNTESKK